MKNTFRTGALFLVLLVLLTSLVSCSSSAMADESYLSPRGKSSDYYGYNDMEYDTSASYSVGGSGTDYSDIVTESGSAKDAMAGGKLVENPEKLVYSADVSLETKEFDEAVAAIRRQITEFSGIVQSEKFYDDMPSNYYYGYDSYYKVSGYKNFSVTIRIPTERFQEFLDTVATVGHLRSSSSYVKNITQEYYSNKSYLDSYYAQMEVLQSMYDKADTIDEMITIESRIAEVQAQINRLTTVISSMDRDVAYSTVDLTVEEVEVYSDTPREAEEKSFIQNVGTHIVNSFRNFVDFLEEFVYWFIDAFWALLILAGLGVLAFFIIRRIVRAYRKKAEAQAKTMKPVGYMQMNPGTIRKPEDPNGK